MSQPAQPSQQTGLNQAGNPADKTNKEESVSQEKSSGEATERRDQHSVPSTHQSDAQPSSLGQGDTGPLKEKDIGESDAAHGWSKDGNLEGEQMRAPGEGEVAQAVKQGGGGGHKEEVSLTSDMDRKKEEHADELHKRGERTAAEIEEEEKEDWTGKRGGVDVGEALGGRETKVVLAPEE